MDDLFLRSATLEVGRPGSQGRLFKTRITFKIEQTDTSISNKAQIQVYNLSPQSLSFLESNDLVAILNVGYGERLEQLLIGDVIQPVKMRKVGPDRITQIAIGDGEKTLVRTSINATARPGQTYGPVIEAAINALGVARGPIRGINAEPLRRGYSYSGSVRDLLNEITETLGLNWSIQNNALQILPKTEYIRTEAVVLSPQTGLLGELSKSERFIVGRSLLNAKIRPRVPLKIISKRFASVVASFSGPTIEAAAGQGFFSVDKVFHAGDSDGGLWESEFYARAIEANEVT